MDLEQELELELAKLDQIFFANEHSDQSIEQVDGMLSLGEVSDSVRNGFPQKHQYATTAFEIAEAEIEREELQDKLRLLLCKTEDFDTQLMTLHAENRDLHSRYSQSIRENERLRHYIEELESHQYRATSSSHKDLLNEQRNDNNDILAAESGPSEEAYRELEFKLAETRARMARFQQNLEDITLARDCTIKELERERLSRIHAEKERDAYSAAYESSLKHLDKWAKTKSFFGMKQGLT